METFTELFPSVHDLLSLKEALGKLAGKIERKRDFFKKTYILIKKYANVK